MNNITVEKTINAPIEKVWKAWTDAKQLKAWHTPTGMDNKDATSDTKEGGAYSITMVTPQGDVTVRGIYQTVEPMKKLVFTWKWDGTPGPDTTVTVEFRAQGDKTDLKLTHTGFTDEKDAAEHHKGWTGVLENLQTFLNQ